MEALVEERDAGQADLAVMERRHAVEQVGDDAGARVPFTVATVAIVPVVILFALIEKRLIGGLTAGAVK